MSPKYPRQKLDAVTIQLFFPGSFAFLNQLPQIQANTADQFPDLYVPNAAEGEPIALAPFQLRNSDSTRSILLSINQCSYASIGRRYPGFETFRDEAKEILGAAFSDCPVPRFNRVGYKYNNRVGVPRSRRDQPLQLSRVIRFQAADWFHGGGLLELDLKWSQDWPGKGALNFAIAERNNQLSFEIGAQVAEVPFEGLWDAVEDAHEKAVSTFEQMITDEYRAAIRDNEEE